MIRSINQIVIGTAQFGMNYGITNKEGQTDKKQVSEILNKAYDHGIEKLDTAAIYGNSESILGNINKTKSYFINTKIPPVSGVAKNFLEYTFIDSLSNLQCNKIEGMFIHDSNDLINDRTIIEKLSSWKEEGYINKIGVSVYEEKEINQIISNSFPIDLIQLPINIFDQRLLQSDILNQIKKNNITIQARSVFLQGLLLENSTKIIKNHPAYKKYHEILGEISAEHQLSQLEFALLFIFQVDQLDEMIIGINNSKQLEEIIKSFNKIKSLHHLLKISWNELAIPNKSLIDPRLW
ncbi:aldo/keto reductase [Salibacterium sp. K-3]